MASGATPFGMRMTISGIQKQFPEVTNLDTDTLAQWMDECNAGISSNGGKDEKDLEQVVEQRCCLVILDVRPEEEAVISMIPSSVRVDPDERDMKKLEKIIREKCLSKEEDQEPIYVVMYCSVGYRSSCLATRLQRSLMKEGKQGAVIVYNLEGSIFKWANENRSLVDPEGEPTQFVHPYNTVFGRLLDASRRKYAP